ncbi:MAG TPA: SET domain-containing protein, partial [Saprospiraceae bacterium]|nr:SET domain-containing protein [Saprospiraceae bacterium]
AAFDPIHAELISKYAYRNHEGHFILCWDFGRYVNHSFNSNCLSTGYDFEIAIRDIKADEELTDDYGYLNVMEPFKARPERSTRKYVLPDDLLRYYKMWDGIVESCVPLIFEVNQPLISLIPQSDLTEIRDFMEGKKTMRSILSHYFPHAHHQAYLQ